MYQTVKSHTHTHTHGSKNHVENHKTTSIANNRSNRFLLRSEKLLLSKPDRQMKTEETTRANTLASREYYAYGRVEATKNSHHYLFLHNKS